MMAMEWKLIDDRTRNGFYCIVGANLNNCNERFVKAYYHNGNKGWYNDSGDRLGFEPTHYFEVEPTPKIIKLEVGDYVRDKAHNNIYMMKYKQELPEYVKQLMLGNYEKVQVTPIV